LFQEIANAPVAIIARNNAFFLQRFVIHWRKRTRKAKYFNPIQPDIYFYRIAQLLAAMIHGISQYLFNSGIGIIIKAVGLCLPLYFGDLFAYHIGLQVFQRSGQLFVHRAGKDLFRKAITYLILVNDDLNFSTREKLLGLIIKQQETGINRR